jgi:transketolase
MDIDALKKAATTIRVLSMDGVQKANSGHPGMPMGCAEVGALLYGEILKHYNKDPEWIDRDRFVLSAGHGSMWLYSLLYLSGYEITMDDLKQFRQLGSPTAGHPEYGDVKGIETTTGPLGAGFSNAVGMAIAEQMLAARFNTKKHAVFDHYTYALSGDGCMMEGITSEAASLAGHLKLGKLIVFYDSNHITIEGSTDLAFSEDVLTRYEGYGWQTLSCDAYDIEAISRNIESAKKDENRPTIILLHSVIGKGSFSMEGSHETHGAPLGEEEIKATKEKLGVPGNKDFYIVPGTEEYFASRRDAWKKTYEEWQERYTAWAKENPELKKELESYVADETDYHKTIELPSFQQGDKVATRAASGKVMQSIAKSMGNLVGGSADLAPSNKTALPEYGDFSAEDRTGRTLHFGVREHAMGGVTNGIALHGGLRPFCATFLVFLDYMRPAVRLAALMKLPVIFLYTHDSIYVGEDGPTHQPVEHLATLRAMPNMRVLRPGDAEETALAWGMALARKEGPTALSLTRQKLEVYEKADPDWKHTVAARGAYIAKECDGTPDVVVAATGSEVTLALQAADLVKAKKVRVVSVMCKELFEAQDKGFREELFPAGVRVVVAETGVRFGWCSIASSPEDILSIESFGESGPGSKVAAHFGFTPENLAKLIDK